MFVVVQHLERVDWRGIRTWDRRRKIVLQGDMSSAAVECVQLIFRPILFTGD